MKVLIFSKQTRFTFLVQNIFNVAFQILRHLSAPQDDPVVLYSDDERVDDERVDLLRLLAGTNVKGVEEPTTYTRWLKERMASVTRVTKEVSTTKIVSHKSYRPYSRRPNDLIDMASVTGKNALETARHTHESSVVWVLYLVRSEVLFILIVLLLYSRR